MVAGVPVHFVTTGFLPSFEAKSIFSQNTWFYYNVLEFWSKQKPQIFLEKFEHYCPDTLILTAFPSI